MLANSIWNALNIYELFDNPFICLQKLKVLRILNSHIQFKVKNLRKPLGNVTNLVNIVFLLQKVFSWFRYSFQYCMNKKHLFSVSFNIWRVGSKNCKFGSMWTISKKMDLDHFKKMIVSSHNWINEIDEKDTGEYHHFSACIYRKENKWMIFILFPKEWNTR